MLSEKQESEVRRHVKSEVPYGVDEASRSAYSLKTQQFQANQFANKGIWGGNKNKSLLTIKNRQKMDSDNMSKLSTVSPVVYEATDKAAQRK